MIRANAAKPTPSCALKARVAPLLMTAFIGFSMDGGIDACPARYAGVENVAAIGSAEPRVQMSLGLHCEQMVLALPAERKPDVQGSQKGACDRELSEPAGQSKQTLDPTE